MKKVQKALFLTAAFVLCGSIALGASGRSEMPEVVSFGTAGRMGLMDLHGKVVVPPRYLEVSPWSGGLVAARNVKGQTVYLDGSGAEQLTLNPGWLGRSFQKEGAWVQIDGKWGLIDQNKAFVISPTYDSVSDLGFQEGWAVVSSGNRWSFVGPSGEVLGGRTWAGLESFFGGLSKVSIDGTLTGLMDPTGEWVEEPTDKIFKIHSEGWYSVFEKSEPKVSDLRHKDGRRVKGPGVGSFLRAWEGGYLWVDSQDWRSFDEGGPKSAQLWIDGLQISLPGLVGGWEVGSLLNLVVQFPDQGKKNLLVNRKGEILRESQKESYTQAFGNLIRINLPSSAMAVYYQHPSGRIITPPL